VKALAVRVAVKALIVKAAVNPLRVRVEVKVKVRAAVKATLRVRVAVKALPVRVVAVTTTVTRKGTNEKTDSVPLQSLSKRRPRSLPKLHLQTRKRSSNLLFLVRSHVITKKPPRISPVTSPVITKKLSLVKSHVITKK